MLVKCNWDLFNLLWLNPLYNSKLWNYSLSTKGQIKPSKWSLIILWWLFPLPLQADKNFGANTTTKTQPKCSFYLIAIIDLLFFWCVFFTLNVKLEKHPQHEDAALADLFWRQIATSSLTTSTMQPYGKSTRKRHENITEAEDSVLSHQASSGLNFIMSLSLSITQSFEELVKFWGAIVFFGHHWETPNDHSMDNSWGLSSRALKSQVVSHQGTISSSIIEEKNPTVVPDKLTISSAA